MTNFIDFFNFNRMPIFDTLFDNFGIIPTNFTNSPKVNIKETPQAYVIEIANPGSSKDDTKIKIEDSVLYVSITSESKEGEGEKENKYHVQQWSKSSYQESWNIPENVIEDEICAKHDNGVLTITLPKYEDYKEEPKTRTIEIK